MTYVEDNYLVGTFDVRLQVLEASSKYLSEKSGSEKAKKKEEKESV